MIKKYFFKTSVICGVMASLPSFALAHSGSAGADGSRPTTYSKVLVDKAYAQNIGLKIVAADEAFGQVVAIANQSQLQSLSDLMHQKNRCGGYELLDQSISKAQAQDILGALWSEQLKSKAEEIRLKSTETSPLQKRQELVEAFDKVSPEAQHAWIQKMAAFETRYHNSSHPNQHVEWLVGELQKMAQASKLEIAIERISHTNTRQDSVRARIVGSSRANEIIVLGGHFDSTVGWFSGNNRSPGADDNASGSSNILESFRILSQMQQPERSIEFYWYAAEEIGLVGSAEIAQSYKGMHKDVVAALQLDMTLEAGSGPLVLASMEDFTSPWLREFLVDANRTYELGAAIIADECGYGCSDHASWFRQGYSTLMPFESSFREMNRDIHTINDTINEASHFAHSAVFTKIALIFAWDLANSTRRAP